MQSTYWLGIVFALIVLVAIFLRMRNEGMKERYATWWVVIAVGVGLTSIFPGVLEWLADTLGVQVPLNLAFFVSAIIFLLMSLQLSVDASRADEERRRLVEEIAILRLRVEALDGDADVTASGSGG